MTQTNAPQPAQGDSSTAIATTLWVGNAVATETARAEAAETTVAANAASALTRVWLLQRLRQLRL